jgi:hypothetical protein
MAQSSFYKLSGYLMISEEEEKNQVFFKESTITSE